MDTVPYIPAAGFSVPHDANSTAHCIQPNLDLSSAHLTSTTPFPVHSTSLDSPSSSPSSSLYKYRKDYQTQPSLRFSHPGLIPPPALASSLSHGIATKQSITAADVLDPSPSTSFTPSPLQSHLQSQLESSYLSHRLKPLGQTPSRGHHLPPQTSAPDFRFGRVNRRGEDAKGLIYAPTHPPPGETAEAAYYDRDRKGSLKAVSRAEEEEVTRPAHRAYTWQAQGIDPAAFRFGLSRGPIDPSGGQVKAALAFEYDEKETALVDTHVVHYTRATKYPVGAGKDIANPLVAHLHSDPQFRFGMASQHDAMGAKAVLRGEYTEAEQEPDADLGRAVGRVGGREGERVGDEDRTYGLPSIRHDRTVPKIKSVANRCNYGDEGSSKALLYPAPYASMGLHDEQFLQERDEAELRRLYERVGVRLKDRQWQVLCERAVKLYGALSVDSLRHAMNRQAMEQGCEVCGAVQCQHPDCVERHCVHDGVEGMGNHRQFMQHERVAITLRKPAGATGTGYTPTYRADSV